MKASITVWLKRRLRLRVNESKSAVDLIRRRKFLGYSMTGQAAPRIKPAAASVERFKGKIRVLFRKARGRNVDQFIKGDLSALLRGWADYFKLSQVTRVFVSLDGWIRRRLRCLLWRQWKTSAHAAAQIGSTGIIPQNCPYLDRQWPGSVVELQPVAHREDSHEKLL